MNISPNIRAVTSTKPLETAVFYDFFMFLQLLALIVLCASIGRLAYLFDKASKRDLLTPSIISFLEWVATFSVVKK